MREACQRLRRFTRGKSFEDYDADELLPSGVERQFEIIGEALNQALKLDPALADEISQSADIVAFRHRLIHGNATVSNPVVWGSGRYLSDLQREVDSLVTDRSDPPAT